MTSFPEDDSDDPLKKFMGIEGSSNWVSPSAGYVQFPSVTNNRSGWINPSTIGSFSAPSPLRLTDDSASKLRLEAAEKRIKSLEEQLKGSLDQIERLQESSETLGSKISSYEEQVSKLRNEEKSASNALSKINAQLVKAEKSLDDTEGKINQLDGQVKNDKLQAIQILALFVAFFTFVSVQFQLFANAKSMASVVALSLVLLGSLLCFVCLTYLGLAYYYVASETNNQALRFNKKFLVITTICGFLLFVSGVGINLWVQQSEENVQTAAQDEKTQAAKECVQLGKAVISELNRNDSKIAPFLQETYQKKCDH